VFGPTAKSPPGPISGILWINDDSIRTLSFDTTAASRGLQQAGWNRIGPTRRRQGRDLAVDILVPATSVARRNLAQIIQEQWRSIGVSATISSVDFPVFQERLRTGRFESFVGAWLDEPSPRGLADQWTSAGVGGLNYGKYRNPAFDALVTRALTTAGNASQARRAWRAALDTLNADAPAIWLYTPVNVAAVSSRVEGVRIDPYSWLTGLTEWRLGPARP
jgi:ABC-type transport system substrate-binding protein